MRSEQNNPFDPTVSRPAYLGGRGEDLKPIHARIRETAAGTGEHVFVFFGYPGVGKTAILETLAATLPPGWVANDMAPLCPAIDDFRPALWSAIDRVIRANKDLTRGEWGKNLVRLARSAKLKVTLDLLGFLEIGAEAGAEPPPTSRYEEIEEVLVALAESAQHHQLAILLSLDEVQNISPEGKTALIYAMEKIHTRKLPLLLVMAGLPRLLDGFLTGKVGISRNWDSREIGPLSTAGCREVLERSARIAREEFEEGALDLLASAADHSPFMVQTYGKICWTVNPKNPKMTLEDAETAIELGNARVDRPSGAFDMLLRSSRSWATDYLTAMAVATQSSGGPAKTADIDNYYLSLGKGRPKGDVRKRLLESGMIFQPDGQRGFCDFAIPGLRAHLLRRAASA